MNKPKALSLALIAVIASGCAATASLIDNVYTLNQDHRIIPHNFEYKYGSVYLDYNAPKPEAIPDPNLEKAPETEPPQASLDDEESPFFVDIEFYNESAVVRNKQTIVDQIQGNLEGKRFLIVGHSHGKSAIGVDRLSAERARFISNMLLLEGVPQSNIFFMSSFSDGGKDYSVIKGARLMTIPKNSSEFSLITGLRS